MNLSDGFNDRLFIGTIKVDVIDMQEFVYIESMSNQIKVRN